MMIISPATAQITIPAILPASNFEVRLKLAEVPLLPPPLPSPLPPP